MINLGDEVMETLAPGQVLFRVHGPDASDDTMVSASVFASKLSALVAALRAADRAVNNAITTDYKIAKLRSSSPTAILAQTPIETKGHHGMTIGSNNPVIAFRRCTSAIITGDREVALSFGSCAKKVSALTQGASRKFGYAEIWPDSNPSDIIRVDPFLFERASAVIKPEKVRTQDGEHKWFKGAAFGSFDGKILEVDLRGALPELKLILSAGDQEIDCVCKAEDIEKIRHSLNHRVRVSGRAIYDGLMGLTIRVEVSDIQSVAGDGDLTKWRGAFEPFEPAPWESDADD